MSRSTNIFLKWSLLFQLIFTGVYQAESAPDVKLPAVPENIRAWSRQLRVDLVWDAVREPVAYEVRRSEKADGDYIPLPGQLTNSNVNVYSDFIGQGGREFYYQIRTVRRGTNGQ